MGDSIKPSKLLYVLSGVIFVIGITLFISLLLSGISSAYKKLDHQVVVPGSGVIELDKVGKYDIFFEYKSTYQGKLYETNNINGLQCILKKLDTNETITLTSPKVHSEYSLSGREGYNIFQFEITKPGKYELSGHYEAGEGEEAVLTIGQGFYTDLLFSILTSIAILFVFLGLSIFILIFTIIKRNKARRLLMQ